MGKTIYIFDFDDTLFWASDWYAEAKIDKDGYIYDPGGSGVLYRALKFAETIRNMDGIPDHFKNIRLRTEKKHQIDRRDIYFELRDSNDEPILLDDLTKYVSKKNIKNAGISVSKSRSPFLTVSNDHEYYLNPETIADVGINEDIFDIYKEYYKESLILTARKDTPILREAILNSLGQYKPKDIYMQPNGNITSGKFKGNVIVNIASSEDVDNIIFYEDNLNYILEINEEVRKYEKLNNCTISNKISIIEVSADKKPLSKLVIAHAYNTIVSSNTYVSNLGFINNIIGSIYD
jgi:hypothetical protein